MIKKIFYLLIPACLTWQVAGAESTPMLLSSAQMDEVTAGVNATVNVGAIGISSVFATTRTDAIAFTGASNNNHPALGGYIEVAGGGAVAAAAGKDASTDTSVTPATSMSGMAGTYTNQSSGHFKGSLVEINANIIYTSGSLFVNPL